MDLGNIIIEVAVLTEVLPLILFLLFRRKLNDKSLDTIIVLIIINCIVDLYSLMQFFENKTNYISYNVSLLLELMTLSIFFIEVIVSKIFKIFVLIAFLLFSANWIYEFIELGQNSILYQSLVIQTLTIIIFCSGYFYQQTTITEHLPRFLIVVAYFIYSSGTLFFLLYLPFLSQEKWEQQHPLTFFLIIIRTILFSLAALTVRLYKNANTINHSNG